MGYFILGNWANLLGPQRDDGNGLTGERHEFHSEALATFMNKHNCANVARAQAVFGQIGSQHHAVKFIDCVIHPTDMLWLM